MAVTTLPVAPTPSDLPAVFNTRGFALVMALAQFVTEVNALQADVTAKSADVTTKAADVVAKHSAVTTMTADVTAKQADITTRQADVTARQADVVTRQADVVTRQADVVTRQADVTAKRSAAATSAANAAASENNAMIYATQQLIGSSSTSLTPSQGAKTFTMEPNKAFVIGQYIGLTSVSDQTHKMGGPLTAYNRATGLASITVANGEFYGSTAKNDWVIGLSALGALVSLTSLNRGAFLREQNGGTLVSNQCYSIWTGGGAIAMNMPSVANTSQGDRILVANIDSTWALNAFTLTCPANSFFFTPLRADDSVLVCNTSEVQAIELVCAFKDANRVRWNVKL